MANKQLLYFTASWCAPCKVLRPIMEELISQGYNIKKVDIDTDNILPVQYLIRSVPTTILLVDGKEVERKIGVQSKEYYINLLR